MAIIASERVALTSSGKISGIGLAKAKTNGFSAILLIIAGFTTPGPDKPRKISAPFITSESVVNFVLLANIFLCELKSDRVS